MRTVRDELRDERVVVARDLAPLVVPRIDAYPVRRAEMQERAGRRKESGVDVLGVKPHLDGVAARRRLAEGKTLTLGDPELLLDEVDVPHELGHRMLDLEPRIHLEEEELPALVDGELDGARIQVASFPGQRDRGVRAPRLELERLAQRLLVA
jgi:peptidoglycan/xylan/chitin deacetylase (PgdA/CDA1 family)